MAGRSRRGEPVPSTAPNDGMAAGSFVPAVPGIWRSIAVMATTKTAAKAPTKAVKIPAPSAKPSNPNEGIVPFRGRNIKVSRPTEAQMAVWQRIANRLSTTTPSDASKILDRYFTIVDTILVDEVDRDWLEDQMLGGQIEIQDASDIVLAAVKLFYGTKPTTTGPKPKARRR